MKVAVIGCGINVNYPRENEKLRNYLKGITEPEPEVNPFEAYNKKVERAKKHFTPGRGE